MKGGHALWVAERDKAVKACPSNKALCISTAGTITSVDMWTIKIASIENGVREHWEIRRLQSRRWRFVDTDNFITITTTTSPMQLETNQQRSNLAGHDKRGKAMLPA